MNAFLSIPKSIEVSPFAYRILIVLTTLSFAIRPVSKATEACHVPKPTGINKGAMKEPIIPRILSSGFVTERRSGEKF